jgi:RHH-type proline utilization regulon transcriptional repressor/proline dehydrogenase/delta 1-pyrroline-5-carboxylate dehydrogenase
MTREATLVARTPVDAAATARGHFVAPAAFVIRSLSQLGHEVFGPVLHVLRYRTGELDALIDALNATGFALTLGIHSRIDATVDRIVARTRAGNVYVNRNMIGAVVGVQPFGGEGLSGTGPKAGGPLYVDRLTCDPGDAIAGAHDLPGPTGERNSWRLVPRGRLVGVGGRDDSIAVWQAQAQVALATGNRIAFAPRPAAREAARAAARSTPGVELLEQDADWAGWPDLAGVLAADAGQAAAANRALAAREGARLPVIEPVGDPPRYPSARLVIERTLSVDTTAAGGNASLVAVVD